MTAPDRRDGDPGADLVARGVDAFGVPGLITGPTGVNEWPDDGLTFEQWDDLGMVASTARDWTAWILGDWLLYGEQTFGRKYVQAESLTRRSYHGLANLRYVSRHVSRSRRREGLSHSHHRLVAPLEPDEQIEWLDRAEVNGWSVDLLDSALKDARSLLTARLKPEGDAQLQLASLAEVAAEILNLERDEHGRVCLDRNMHERLRAAVEASA